MDKPYLTEFIQEKKIDDNSNKIKSMKIFNSFIKENLEKPPSNTILENNIKNSIINSYQELDLENKKLSMEEFSKIFDSYQEEKSESILINFEELQPEFLKVKKMNPLLNEVFENNIINQFGKNSIENLSNHILSLKIFIDNITENQLISPLININELIEGNYNFDGSYIKKIKY
jgi:superfamily I DNA/RNA helicase